MSYEKYTWQTGEVITADKLNHMEEGILVGNIYFVTATMNPDTGFYTINESYTSLKNKLDAGYLVAWLNKKDEGYYGYSTLYVLTDVSYTSLSEDVYKYQATFGTMLLIPESTNVGASGRVFYADDTTSNMAEE